jgi:hypothetical protein
MTSYYAAEESYKSIKKGGNDGSEHRWPKKPNIKSHKEHAFKGGIGNESDQSVVQITVPGVFCQ